MRAFLALATVAAAGVAGAADEQGNFAIKGAGTATCEQYLSSRDQRSQDFYVYAGWIDGYLTATNRYREGVYDISPWATAQVLTAVVARQCEQNPDTPFHVVVQGLVRELAPQRLEARSELVRFEAEDQGVLIYQEILRRVQAALQRAGHYGAAVDGVPGPQTRAALRRYQRAQGLDVTGLPDQRTLLELLARSDG